MNLTSAMWLALIRIGLGEWPNASTATFSALEERGLVELQLAAHRWVLTEEGEAIFRSLPPECLMARRGPGAWLNAKGATR